MRVQDLAKKHKLSTKAILDLLRELGYQVRGSSSTVTEEMAKAVENVLEEQKKRSKQRLERKKEIWGQRKPGQQRPAASRRPTSERVQDRIRKTLQKPSERRSKRPPQRRRERRPARPGPAVEPTAPSRTLHIPAPISVSELAQMMGLEPIDVVKRGFELGIMATINQVLDLDSIELIADSFGFEVVRELPEEEQVTETGEEEFTEPRPPVVTVMGHVDHGKTTLLDYIRRTNVAAREFGAITQHIGASRVFYEGHQITFIDTPGHEAFTALRARGAQVTDIVVLVVAANEGVKPQTVEAINHAKAAGVPIIVAINKMDLPDADPERVKRELSEHGLIPEEWGGQTIFVEVSAKTGQGVPDLLEAILLKAEELELRSTSEGPARAVVLESKLEKGRGPVASVIVQRGTLRVGDAFVAGTAWGKVRAIYDEYNQRLKELKPSDPGLVQGFDALPKAGDILQVVESERVAREIAEEKAALIKEQIARGEQASLTRRIQEMLQKGEITELPVIVKADCQGSVEAVGDALGRMMVEDIKVTLVHSGIGNVTESDVMLAAASNALILAFNVNIDSKAREAAKREGVTIKSYRLIYDLLEDVELILKSLLKPEVQEEVLGEAEVRAVFKVPKVGHVAGCYVLRGVIRRDANIRVRRNGEVIHEGRVASLKRFKEDVKEVAQGYECGIKVQGFEDYRPGDILEAYRLVEVKKA